MKFFPNLLFLFLLISFWQCDDSIEEDISLSAERKNSKSTNLSDNTPINLEDADLKLCVNTALGYKGFQSFMHQPLYGETKNLKKIVCENTLNLLNGINGQITTLYGLTKTNFPMLTHIQFDNSVLKVKKFSTNDVYSFSNLQNLIIIGGELSEYDYSFTTSLVKFNLNDIDKKFTTLKKLYSVKNSLIEFVLFSSKFKFNDFPYNGFDDQSKIKKADIQIYSGGLTKDQTTIDKISLCKKYADKNIDKNLYVNLQVFPYPNSGAKRNLTDDCTVDPSFADFLLKYKEHSYYGSGSYVTGFNPKDYSTSFEDENGNTETRLYYYHVEDITNLNISRAFQDVSEKSIDLKGIKYFKNLNSLVIVNSRISNFRFWEIARLTKMTFFSLDLFFEENLDGLMQVSPEDMTDFIRFKVNNKNLSIVLDNRIFKPDNNEKINIICNAYKVKRLKSFTAQSKTSKTGFNEIFQTISSCK